MHSIIVQKRRKRSINFTDFDRQVLTNLVQPHISVIENKRMDKFTSKLKSETWENIKTQYNQLNAEPRTAVQLKLLYEANKYRMRRGNKITPESNDLNEKNAGLVKIELERKTILDALAQTEVEQIESQMENDQDSPKAKIKCVNIEKLQEMKQSEITSPAKSNPSTDKNTNFLPPSILGPSSLQSHLPNPRAILLPNSSTISSNLSSSSDSNHNKQDELHAIRMKILEDERLFRRQEHLKHMEYFEIGIMALKTFLLKQATAQSTAFVASQK